MCIDIPVHFNGPNTGGAGAGFMVFSNQSLRDQIHHFKKRVVVGRLECLKDGDSVQLPKKCCWIQWFMVDITN